MPSIAVEHQAPLTANTSHTASNRALASLRILLGAVLLWAFADKAFGLGFSTPHGKSWITGNSPTAGYLGSLKGWLAESFQPLAGNPMVDIAFMLGLLLVGLSLALGVALRPAAAGGTVLMALMWLSALPIKTNPVLDEHVIYAAAMIVLATARAGRTWGLGSRWEQLLLAAPQPVRTALS